MQWMFCNLKYGILQLIQLDIIIPIVYNNDMVSFASNINLSTM